MKKIGCLAGLIIFVCIGFVSAASPQMQEISPEGIITGDTWNVLDGTVDFVFDFQKGDDPLYYLELDIVGPDPWNDGSGERIQITLAANESNLWVLDNDSAKAGMLGVTVSYSEVEEKWTITVDTDTTWVYGPHPYFSYGDPVWPDGQYHFYIEVGDEYAYDNNNLIHDATDHQWGNMYTTPEFAQYLYYFHSIQDAIDSANDGDTIYVSDGTYEENVLINKPLTLQAGSNPVIIGDSENYIIKIDSTHDVIIDGLEINGGGSGAGDNNFDYGVLIKDSNDVGIKNSVIKNIWKISGNGINIEDSTNVEIYNCTISSFHKRGIRYVHSTGKVYKNEIIGDNVDGTSRVQNLVNLWTGSNVEIYENILYNALTVGGSPTWDSPGIFVSSYYGSYPDNGDSYANIHDNKIYDCDTGIVVTSVYSTTDTSSADIINNYFYNIATSVSFEKNTASAVINYNFFENITNSLDWSGPSTLDAEYNWWGDCTGPYNETTNPDGLGSAVSGNIDYTPWLGACITNKTNVTCAIENQNITVSANVDGTDIDSVIIIAWINGTQKTYPTTKNGNLYSGTIPSSDLVGGMDMTWNVFVTDNYDFNYTNGNKTVYVRKSTYLGVIPWPFDGEDGWFVTEPLFSLTKDSTGGNIYYQWDDDIFLYSGPFKLEDISNLDKESAGKLELNWWTEFACGNESEQSQMFNIDLTNPQVVDLNPEDGGTVYNNPSPEVSAYLDEVYQSNSGINESTIIMKIDGSEVTPTITDSGDLDKIVSYTPNLNEGWHDASVNVTDNSGRNNYTIWSFYINLSSAFSMVVNSPVDGIYGKRRIPFNINLEGDVDLLEYINWADRNPRWKRLCRNCDEYGSTRKKTKSFRDGEHNITIRATDSSNQVRQVNISFSVDSKKPRISRTYPRRNKVTNGSDFYIKYTEDNLKEVLVSFNSTIALPDCNESGRNIECDVQLDLSLYDGQEIAYWFNVSDFVRSISSRVTSVMVDTTSPELHLNMPENTDYGRRIPFNITVDNDEKTLIEYYDESSSRPRWKRLCNNCNEYGNSKTKTKSFRRGDHSLIVRTVDKAGNSDSERIDFTVDY